MNKQELVEQLAAREHENWATWMRHVLEQSAEASDGTVIIPQQFIALWEQQCQTPYRFLPERVQQNVRDEVQNTLLPLIDAYVEAERTRQPKLGDYVTAVTFPEYMDVQGLLVQVSPMLAHVLGQSGLHTCHPDVTFVPDKELAPQTAKFVNELREFHKEEWYGTGDYPKA